MLIANSFRTNAENQGQNAVADVILPSVNALPFHLAFGEYLL